MKSAQVDQAVAEDNALTQIDYDPGWDTQLFQQRRDLLNIVQAGGGQGNDDIVD
jgi:hypothetical protein